MKLIVAALSLVTVSTVFALEESTPEVPPIEVGIVVGSTDFFAHNFSTRNQVLFFRAGTFTTWRVLGPGATFTSTYARQALDGVKLEVASYEDGVWRTSRGFDLSTLCDSGADAVWIQEGPQPPSWLEVGTQLTPLTPEPSGLPSGLTTTTNEAAPVMEPLHVPVVTPVDRPNGDTPPVLDERPLPPV